MIRIYNSLADYQSSMAGRESNTTRVESTVRTILQDVRVRGDAAVAEYTKKFDRVEPASLRVADEEKDKAVAYMDPAMRDIWIQAIHNIETYHQRQKEDSSLEFFADGSVLGWKVTPLDRVGVYIPGGQAVYPSSLLMNVIPARIAGVEQIVVATPPGADGLPHKDILAAAALLEVDEIYVMGGAQAVGALAYGTKTIPAVHKITGPGNQYVAEAKRQVYGVVGIDSVAGPSEILILSDGSAEVSWIARDLLSQAEHDPEARALLVTTSRREAEEVAAYLKGLVSDLPRKEIISASLGGPSAIIVVEDLAQGVAAANIIAPEHLEVLTADPFGLLHAIRHAGAVFLGPYTPEPVGDYFAGPNHTLPTGGTARFSSPLSVQDFTKKTSVLGYSPQRLEKEGESIARFADREQLFAHAEAVRIRKKGKS